MDHPVLQNDPPALVRLTDTLSGLKLRFVRNVFSDHFVRLSSVDLYQWQMKTYRIAGVAGNTVITWEISQSQEWNKALKWSFFHFSCVWHSEQNASVLFSIHIFYVTIKKHHFSKEFNQNWDDRSTCTFTLEKLNM